MNKTIKQLLIVEGNDGYVISSLLIKKGVSPPLGYETKKRFKKFINSAGSLNEAIKAFDIELDNPDYTKIGLIVDADEKGPQARYQKIKVIVEKKFSVVLPKELPQNGFVCKEKSLPTIGLWVMPDNVNKGYLEHFVAELIEDDNEIWKFSNKTVDDFKGKEYCTFPEVRTQKARVHTFLALQEKPGLPMGLGINTRYIGAKSKSADIFEEWFKQTFVLAE